MRQGLARFLFAVPLVSLTLAGCGGGGGDTAAKQPVASSPEAPPPASPPVYPPTAGSSRSAAPPGPPSPSGANAAQERSIIPDVTVIDVASGEKVRLATLAPASRPILLWFYAPH